MFKKANEQKDVTIAKAVKGIQNEIDYATSKGLNKVNIFTSDYYMGSEVTDSLKEAGYFVKANQGNHMTGNYYTISW